MGFADALAAPEAAASLLGAGYRVVSFTRRGRPVALRRMSAIEIVEVTAPEDDFAACAEEVAAVAAAHDVTMPLDDPAVLVCDHGLPADALVAGARGAQAALALDKRTQLEAAALAGLAVPEWQELFSEGPRSDLTEGWTRPVVLKPALAAEVRDGRLRRLSPQLVETQQELEDLRRSWGSATPAIVQRWVSGRGAGVFGLADRGGVHHLSAHRRVRMMNPAGSGSSACASAPVDPELVDPVGRLLGVAGWRGMFMVELLRSEDTWWFMELNGRPWGSLALARRLGFEYPAWAVARLLDDGAVLPEEPGFEDLLCRNLGRELVHLVFVLRGPQSKVDHWPGRAETLRAMLSRSNRTAWYNLQPGMRRLFLNDAWRTLAHQTWEKGRA
jgi:hypothetical protein